MNGICFNTFLTQYFFWAKGINGGGWEVAVGVYNFSFYIPA